MLNYTLSLIYPYDDVESNDHIIPLTELMCLMDADQTCSSTFFINLMRYMDSGDDVAAALSPKCTPSHTAHSYNMMLCVCH